MKKLSIITALILIPASAQAVSLREIIRNCNADSKTYCSKEGYGDAMTRCLTKNIKKISPGCKGVVRRLNSGEKFSFF